MHMQVLPLAFEVSIVAYMHMHVYAHTHIHMQVLPLAFEVSIVAALLAHQCGGTFTVVTLATLGLYGTFTFLVTSARTKVRKAQNAADTKASQIFNDSMINYETVKYFDATAHEERRYDHALASYEKAAITTQLTLAGLNFGQSAILPAGLLNCLNCRNYLNRLQVSTLASLPSSPRASGSR